MVLPTTYLEIEEELCIIHRIKDRGGQHIS